MNSQVTHHDLNVNKLKHGQNIVPRPATNEAVRGVLTAKWDSQSESWAVYRKGRFIGLLAIGGGYSPVRGYENFETLARAAIGKALTALNAKTDAINQNAS